MRLAIFGATGGTGEQVVRQALAAGHQVTAFARRPDALRTVFPQLHIVQGDIDDCHAVHQAVADTDGVLSALGSRTMKAATTVYSTGTTTILTAMQKAGTRRFVGVSAAPVAPATHTSLVERHVVHPLLHRSYGGGYNDMRRMEDLLAASECDWTVFRPPRLTDKPAIGHYRTAVDGPLARAWSLSRGDLATAMLAAAHDTTLAGHTVTIAA